MPIGIIISLAISCKRDRKTDLSPSPIKLIVTTDTSIIPDIGGAELYGSLTNYQQASDYGFAYSTDSLLKMYPRYVRLGKPGKNGSFHFNINRDLEKGKKYFYRAYAIQDSSFVPGEIRYFISNGSRPLRLDSISHLQAHIGDTVELYGKDLDQSYIYVAFSGIYSNIVKRNDTVISCVVPAGMPTDKPLIKVSNFSLQDSLKGFHLYTPIITGFTDQQTFRDTVVIKGEHFDKNLEGNKVLWGNIPMQVVTAERTELKVIIPDNLVKATDKLFVSAQIQTAAGKDSIHLKRPEIIAVPASGATNSQIIITGKYFHPLLWSNRVTMEDQNTTLISGSTTELKATVPFGPFPRRKAWVKVKVVDMEITYPISFELTDPWLRVANLPFWFIRDPGSFVINDQAYLLVNDRKTGSSPYYIAAFHPKDFSWTSRPIPAEIDVSRSVVLDNGKNAYVCTGGTNNALWEYAPGTNTWKRKADFPGPIRWGAASFAIGNKLYIGLGVIPDVWSMKYLEDFYEYNTDTDKWRKISSIPEPQRRSESSTFVVNGQGYVLGGVNESSENACWRYNPSLDTWSRVANFPGGTVSLSKAFGFNGKGYVLHPDYYENYVVSFCWEYNPLNNSWTKGHNIDHLNFAEGPFAFIQNGNVYVGGGTTQVLTQWNGKD